MQRPQDDFAAGMRETGPSSAFVVALSCLMALASAGSAQAEKFTIAAIPDTQSYTTSDANMAGFNAQVEFIAAHREALNIVFATHLGDMVNNNSYISSQWNRAIIPMKFLRDSGHVPFGIAIGNHDYDYWAPPAQGIYFWYNFFGPSFFSGRDWYRYNWNNPTDSYQIFYGGGRAFLHIVLELEASTNSWIWAQQIMDEHPGMPVIISTHQFITFNGNLSSNNYRGGSTAAEIWYYFLRNCPQVTLVLCGHSYSETTGQGEGIKQLANINGKPVYFWESDYQGVGGPGSGWMRLIEFDSEARSIQVRTYSPLLDQWQTDSDSQFSISFDLEERFGPVPACLPPLVITPPVNQQVPYHSTATPSVFAQGTEPLSYEWSKDGLPLLDATNASLLITNAGDSNAGSYSVVITNLCGAATSAPSLLTLTWPCFTNQWSAVAGDKANLSAFALKPTGGLYPSSVMPAAAMTETFRLRKLTLYRPADTTTPLFGTGPASVTNAYSPVFLDVYSGRNSTTNFTGYLGSSSSGVTWSSTVRGASYSFSFSPALGIHSGQKHWIVFSEDRLPGEVSAFRALVNTSGTDITPGAGRGYLTNDTTQMLVFQNGWVDQDWAIVYNAEFSANYPPLADGSATQPLWIAGQSDQTKVVLDGTKSSDPDGDLLGFTWFETGCPDVVATGAIAVVQLQVGAHSLSVVASDGLLMATNDLTIEVISPAEAVERLAESVEDGESKSLIATINAALASIERSNPVSCVNQLLAFQQKVRIQLEPLDPALASEFAAKAQAIIESITGGGTNPGGRPHGNFIALEPQTAGPAILRLNAEPHRIYILEASTNLSEWEMISVGKEGMEGQFIFQDPNANFFDHRLYRVVTP